MPFNLWHDLPAGPRPPDELNAIIEIPRGSRNKYELDKETGLFRFDRILYSAVHYPADYGFIPRTLADDDDPLDVLVMVTLPTFPGCLIPVRPIGVFEMRDEKGLDEKVLAVPLKDPLYDGYHDLDDVPPHFLREVEHWSSPILSVKSGLAHAVAFSLCDRSARRWSACCSRLRVSR